MLQVVIFFMLAQVTCQLDLTETENVTSLANATNHNRSEQPRAIPSFGHQDGLVIVSMEPPFVKSGENSKMERMTTPGRISTNEDSTKNDTESKSVDLQTAPHTMTPGMITEAGSTQSPELTSAAVESNGTNSSVNMTSWTPSSVMTGSVSDLSTSDYGQKATTHGTKTVSEKNETEMATTKTSIGDSASSINMTSQGQFLHSTISFSRSTTSYNTDESKVKSMNPPRYVDDFTNVVNMTTFTQQPDSKQPNEATTTSRITSEIHDVFSETRTDFITPESSNLSDTKSEGINNPKFNSGSSGSLNQTSKSMTSRDGRTRVMFSSVPKLVPAGVPAALTVALLCSLSA